MHFHNVQDHAGPSKKAVSSRPHNTSCLPYIARSLPHAHNQPRIQSLSPHDASSPLGVPLSSLQCTQEPPYSIRSCLGVLLNKHVRVVRHPLIPSAFRPPDHLISHIFTAHPELVSSHQEADGYLQFREHIPAPECRMWIREHCSLCPSWSRELYLAIRDGRIGRDKVMAKPEVECRLIPGFEKWGVA